MTDMDALFGAQVKAGDNQLKTIASLIEDEGKALDDKVSGEAIVSEAKQRLNELRHKLIPEAMANAGVADFTTDNGIKAELAWAVDGALGDEDREAKLDLLERHGGGEIIRNEVVIPFAKGKEKEMAFCLRLLQGNVTLEEIVELEESGGFAFERQRGVHHMTLKSWLKGKMEAEEESERIPLTVLEKLGMWYGRIVKIKRPKQT